MILNICIFMSIFGILLNFNYLAYPFHNKYNKSKHFLQINFFLLLFNFSYQHLYRLILIIFHLHY